ncbi:MAG TPA: carbohydrate ABC transporter permease [Opitutaceae bacterium]|nr:carbohydrate ABC transporter permease [Opitutaceae bacterium]
MALLSKVGRRNWSQRAFVVFLYLGLTVFGTTMAIPFLITLTSSASNAFDYERFSIVPRSLWSKEDRFVKGLAGFINRYPGWFTVLQDNFREAPPQWTSWQSIGLDAAGVDRVARFYLEAKQGPTSEQRRAQARDYAEFVYSYPLDDSLCAFSDQEAARYIVWRYEQRWADAHPKDAAHASSEQRTAGMLAELSRQWELPVTNLVTLGFENEVRAPIGQQSWVPPATAKQADYYAFCQAQRSGFSTPGVLKKWRRFLRGHGLAPAEVERLVPLPENASAREEALWLEFARDVAPASPVMPFPMRLVWLQFLTGEDVRRRLALPNDEQFDIARYNALAGTDYASLADTPFPLPAEGFAGLRPLWREFVENRYPLRLTRIVVTPELQRRFEEFLRNKYRSLENINRLLGGAHRSWEEFRLTDRLPAGAEGGRVGERELWMNFVKSLPAELRVVESSEKTYQQLIIARYRDVAGINRAYGWNLRLVEEARAPFDQAYAATYEANRMAFAWAPLVENYKTIVRFLLRQGNAISVTLWLIVLSIATALTVNPLAGYALSRFSLRNKDKIILFCLATSAFPAMVSAIPGYLLMRDLGMLNTFFALVLPTAANGMGIFILKGFFDSLPQELYEAATLDGAKEWQVLVHISLPMVKPILAINALNAFLAAYGGWEWALIVCQDHRMWTISVWLYQASDWWVQTPWVTSAGFVLVSIPILVVFLFCQRIILRGIIIPSMK